MDTLTEYQPITADGDATDDRVVAFIRQHATPCGGDWTGMLFSAIRYGNKEAWDSLEDDREYTFMELWAVIRSIV